MYSGFFFIDSLVFVHLGTLKTYILTFSTSMRAKINSNFFSPWREEMKAHIISSQNWDFKKKHRHFDLHNEVTRVGSCLDFIFQESLFCSYNIQCGFVGKEKGEEKLSMGVPSPTISMLLPCSCTDCSAGSSFFCLGLGSGTTLCAVSSISCNRLHPYSCVLGKTVLEHPSCCYSFRSLRTI